MASAREWKEQADHMTLLKLPTEIRTKILEAVFVSTGAYLTFDCGGDSFDKIRRKGAGNSSQVLRTCNLFSQEGLPILYGHNHFIITFLQHEWSWTSLSESLFRKIGPKNVALLRNLTITGDHELNEVIGWNLPLPRNVANRNLAIPFEQHPGLANLQSLWLEFPTYDAWHDIANQDFRLWLDELPSSIAEEIREANEEIDANHFRSNRLDGLSGRVTGCIALWAALRGAGTTRLCCPALRFFHIGGCRHGPLLIITKKPVDATETFEHLEGMSRTQVTTALSVDFDQLSVKFAASDWFVRLNRIFQGQMI